MTSPAPQYKVQETLSEETLLDFPAAMKAIIDGQEVSKKEWDDSRTRVLLFNGHLSIKLHRNRYVPLDMIVSDGDLFGKDWFIV